MKDSTDLATYLRDVEDRWIFAPWDKQLLRTDLPMLVHLVRELNGALIDLLRAADRHEADALQGWLDHACGNCIGYDTDRGTHPQLCARHAAREALASAEAMVKEKG